MLLALVLGLVAPPAALAVSGPARLWVPVLLLAPTVAVVKLGVAAEVLPVAVHDPVMVLAAVTWLASVLGGGLLAHRIAPSRAPVWLLPVLVAAGYLLVGRVAMFGAGQVLNRAHVDGISMRPTLGPGQDLLVARGPLLGTPGPGDVVLVAPPEDRPGRPWVKRIVATGGQTVGLRAGEVFVDGVSVQQGPAEEVTIAAGRHCAAIETRLRTEVHGDKTVRVIASGDVPRSDIDTRRVPEGHVFLLGDQRDGSLDSRTHGVVPMEALVGRVLGVAHPLGGCGDESAGWGDRP